MKGVGDDMRRKDAYQVGRCWPVDESVVAWWVALKMLRFVEREGSRLQSRGRGQGTRDKDSRMVERSSNLRPGVLAGTGDPI